MAYLTVCLTFVACLVWMTHLTLNVRTQAERNRLVATAIQYQGCIRDNTLTAAVDTGVQAALALVADEPEEIVRILRDFRTGLTPLDCESIVATLDHDDRRTAFGQTLTTRPLPPATIP